MNDAPAYPQTPPAPDANPDAEPDYFTPLDAYAGQALNGMLAQGGYPHEHESLAEKSFEIARSMLRERSKHFAQHPVGGLPATGHPLANSMPPIAGEMELGNG